MSTERLLKIREVASLLGMQESGVRRWAALRKLPVVRLGRMVRVPASWVEQFIARNTVPAREERGQ